ncbi:MAG: polysaccharide biosynthesis protein GumN [Alphaproteobacteria bacterium]|nr:MAG: polysaccharide biosynthesis protein GumN [Alphaproteobacteria bacterium]PZO37467.1 MAG: polysaccharide biosynthesis protein GumN [Alphaproteobacteria bacterium]
MANKSKYISLAVLSAAIIAMPATALAQTADDAVDTVDEIVVEARRSGAPIWEVSRNGSTVLLVGEINGVPEATPWSASALEAATGRSQRVMSGIGVQGSFRDLVRVMWRMRTLTTLPGGTTSADYLEPRWQARLDAIEARVDKDYSRSSFLITAGALMRDGAGYGRDTADDAGDVVRRAARKARVPVRSVEAETRGDKLVDDLLTAPPESRLTCMYAAIEAAEAGPEAVLARGRAWTRFEVTEVMSSPVEKALGVCWPWGDPELGPQLKTAWTSAIEEALTQTGVTMAVAPLGLLAEAGGVLDRLESQGAVIEGPEWKAR